MANAKTFILSQLTDLIETFPEIKASYKFDGFNHEHLVEIVSSKPDVSCHHYEDSKADLLFKFIGVYPYDTLIFLSEDDWISIENPDQVLVGKEFQEDVYFEPSFVENDFFTFSKSEDDMFNVADIIQDARNQIIENFSTFKAKASIIQDVEDWLEIEKACECQEAELIYGYNQNEPVMGRADSSEDDCNCVSYALAA